jgi:DNA-binding PadR family transcriptional regulator
MESARSNDTSTAAMRSPINWALLGLLIARASYGYELMQRFERTYGDTLELSSRSQIYTALDSLARRGLIERVQGARVADPLLRQPKPHYRASDAGIRAYERWLIEQVSDDERRSRLIAGHFAALPSEHALRVLERSAEVCLDAASRLSAEDNEHRSERPQALAERLAGEEERLRAGAILTWIEYARSELCTAASGTRR